MSSVEEKKVSFTLSEFALRQAHIELRSAPNYLLWDKAGGLWTEMIARFPKLTWVQSEPNKTVFSLENRYVCTIYVDHSVSSHHTRIIASAFSPSNLLKDFSELAKTFVETAQRHLEIAEYSRIGLRLLYHKDFEDRGSASQALLSAGILRIPKGPHFGVVSEPVLPEYSVRWEGGTHGATIRGKVEAINLEFTPPLDWDGVDSITKRKNRLAYDIDYYTMASVGVGQFSVVDWLSQAVHVVNRDLEKLMR